MSAPGSTCQVCGQRLNSAWYRRHDGSWGRSTACMGSCRFQLLRLNERKRRSTRPDPWRMADHSTAFAAVES